MLQKSDSKCGKIQPVKKLKNSKGEEKTQNSKYDKTKKNCKFYKKKIKTHNLTSPKN